MTPTHALVREVSAGFARALSTAPDAATLDPARARIQHAAYVQALKDSGLAVHVLPGDPGMPDCCFVEDTAVVGRTRALLTRPGHPARQGEPAAVGSILGKGLELVRMEAPATLDGGDCLKIDARVYVGQSARTNALGIQRLRDALEPDGFTIQVVKIQELLHLKCACSYLGRGHLLLAESLPREPFRGLEILPVPTAEAYAANAVAVGNRVLMARGFPATQRMIAKAGFEVIPLDTTEFRKADGSLTCLSVLYTPFLADSPGIL
jgi:dimethylargininase